MPIETNLSIRSFSQSQFGSVAYEVVAHAIRIHKTLGRIFDESIYRRTLARILASRAAEQVCIRLTHRGFEKLCFIDLVVDSGCPFELKVTSQLHDRHRGQLIQYLMLTGLRHGKLINFGGETLEHEFVNCHETEAHRRSFKVDLSRWFTTCGEANEFQEILLGLLRDWGTGLDRGLYIEAIAHFLGGLEAVHQSVETLWEGEVVGRQFVNLAGNNTAFEVTCLRNDLNLYELHLKRLLANSSLERILWANVISGNVSLVALSDSAQPFGKKAGTGKVSTQK